MRVEVVTLFPEFFETPLATGLVGRALGAGSASVRFVNPRDFTTDVHRTVDDTPYGGGAGMVMKPEPLLEAIAAARGRVGGPVVLMSPQGRPLRQRTAERWAGLDGLVLVAGRYEGVDERVRDAVDEECSLGDYVLTGGEYAALVVIDAVLRLRPGTVGNAGSLAADSFSEDLLEHPHYTRPVVLGGAEVPAVLRSGDHKRIEAWRHSASLQRTWTRRPDLLEDRRLSAEDRRFLFTSDPGPRPEIHLLAGPGAQLESLAELVAGYRLAGAWVRGVEASALRGWCSDAPAPRLPPLPGGSRRVRSQHAADRGVALAELGAARSRVRSLPEVLPFAGLRVGVGPGSWDAPSTSAGALRVRQEPILLVADQDTPVDCRLAEPRQVSPFHYFSQETVLAISLDRVLGEG